MSGAPICSGIIQFASPTNAGMIAEDHAPARARSRELKNVGSTNRSLGLNNSNRISGANDAADEPHHTG